MQPEVALVVCRAPIRPGQVVVVAGHPRGVLPANVAGGGRGEVLDIGGRHHHRDGTVDVFFGGKKGLDAIFYEKLLCCNVGSLRMCSRPPSPSYCRIIPLWWHFLVAKRALVAFFGGKKALWCTFLRIF